jgi:hypothetical protein
MTKHIIINDISSDSKQAILEKLQKKGVKVQINVVKPFMAYEIELPLEYLNYTSDYVKYSRNKEHEEVVLLLKSLKIVQILNHRYSYSETRETYKKDKLLSVLQKIG